MRESAIVTYDNKVIDYSIGCQTSVEFNFERIWDFKNKTKFFKGSFLEFIHVHPENFNYVSSVDVMCATGLEIAFGFPIYFTIVTFDNSDVFDSSSTLSLFKIIKGNIVEQDVRNNISENLLLFLKFLSYSNLISKE